MVESAYLAVALIGLLHGFEPGHGWPIATMYSTRLPRPLLRGLVSSWVISVFHMISSIAIIVPFVFLKLYLNYTLPYVNYIAGIALIIISLKLLTEKTGGEAKDQHGHIHEDFQGVHEHEHAHEDKLKHSHKHKHAKRIFLTLSSIAIFALILGFAHEEEFVLLSLAVAGIDPLLLMITYSFAVMASLIGVTLIAIQAYKAFEARIKKYEHLVPKVSGLVLLVMGMSFILGLR